MKILLSILLMITYNNPISTSHFYEIFSGSDIEAIQQTINELEKGNQSELETVYLGALLTKKANSTKDIKEKIEVFKNGVKLIDTAVSNSPENIEYRFIRYIIQENAPKILKYNTKIAEDKAIIEAKFQKCNSILQNEIQQYNKISKTLKL